MRLFEKSKNWILVALLLCGVISIILVPIMLGIFLRGGIAVMVFVTVLVIGPAIDRKMEKHFKKEMEGGKKE